MVEAREKINLEGEFAKENAKEELQNLVNELYEKQSKK